MQGRRRDLGPHTRHCSSRTFSWSLLHILALTPYVIFVADPADIARGTKTKEIMWSNFASHGNLLWSYGTKLLYMTSNLAPHDNIVCRVE